LKAIGNVNRLKILINLIKEPKAFGTLLKEIKLKRTALSNHLAQLINTNLIEKADYGVYKITGDGREFMKNINEAYYGSPTRLLSRFEKLQSGKISDSFLNRYSG
jgi:DNA-binding HxlR family transcriptional regulator